MNFIKQTGLYFFTILVGIIITILFFQALTIIFVIFTEFEVTKSNFYFYWDLEMKACLIAGGFIAGTIRFLQKKDMESVAKQEQARRDIFISNQRAELESTNFPSLVATFKDGEMIMRNEWMDEVDTWKKIAASAKRGEAVIISTDRSKLILMAQQMNMPYKFYSSTEEVENESR